MNLSDLQSKDIININDGKKVGVIVDAIIDINGNLEYLVMRKNKLLSNFFPSKDEIKVKWAQIKKIGEDVILVDVNI